MTTFHLLPKETVHLACQTQSNTMSLNSAKLAPFNNTFSSCWYYSIFFCFSFHLPNYFTHTDGPAPLSRHVGSLVKQKE